MYMYMYVLHAIPTHLYRKQSKSYMYHLMVDCTNTCTSHIISIRLVECMHVTHQSLLVDFANLIAIKMDYTRFCLQNSIVTNFAEDFYARVK